MGPVPGEERGEPTLASLCQAQGGSWALLSLHPLHGEGTKQITRKYLVYIFNAYNAARTDYHWGQHGQRPVTLCKVQWRAETGEISQIGLVISDKDIGDGGDTEAGVEHKAGERESLHQLQDTEQVTVPGTLGLLQTRHRGQRRGCRDEASQVWTRGLCDTSLKGLCPHEFLWKVTISLIKVVKSSG